MESNNQKKNVENWYTQNGEHYICSFGEEYEQHFTETKNTDGGCAILTNQHCYLQGKYLFEPKKKSKACSIDEKITLHNVMKCGIRYSFRSILLVCILLVGWLISIVVFKESSDYLNYLYISYNQKCEIKLSKQPLKMYEEKIDEYNQMVNTIKNDITENGANASCVYLLSENQEIDDIVEQYKVSKITGLRIYIKQVEVDYNRIGDFNNYYKGASTYVWLLSEFADYDESPLLMTEDTYPGENVFDGTYYDVDVDLEHQRHLNKIFSTPESLFNELDSYLEHCYTEYLCEYFNGKFSENGFNASDFDGLEWQITNYENNLRNAIENWLEPLFLYACIISIMLVIAIPLFIFGILKTKYFYFIYRTDTLDYKKLYLPLKKKLFIDAKLFSLKLEIAKNAKENSLLAIETANQRSSENPSVNSLPDDLRKYAEILKDGIITQEEFDAMKQKILGL